MSSCHVIGHVTLCRRLVRCSTENCSFWNLSSSRLCFSTAYFSRRFSCFTCSRLTQHRALLSAAQYPHELLLGPPQLLRPPREVVLALVRPRPRHRRPRPGLGARTQALLQLLRKLGPEKSYMHSSHIAKIIGLKPDVLNPISPLPHLNTLSGSAMLLSWVSSMLP